MAKRIPTNPDASVFLVLDEEGKVLIRREKEFRGDNSSRMVKEQTFLSSLYTAGAVYGEVRSPRGYRLHFIFRNGKAALPEGRLIKQW